MPKNYGESANRQVGVRTVVRRNSIDVSKFVLMLLLVKVS